MPVSICVNKNVYYEEKSFMLLLNTVSLRLYKVSVCL